MLFFLSAGFPSPTITWSKLRSPLPWRHKVVDSSLVLPNVGRQDSGEYICSATNSLGTSDVTVMLDVESEGPTFPPRRAAAVLLLLLKRNRACRV